MKCCKPAQQSPCGSTDMLIADDEGGARAQTCEPEQSRGGKTNFTPPSSDAVDMPTIFLSSLHSLEHLKYMQKMENDFICLQKAFLTLTTHFARVQFRLRQIMAAEPCERNRLLLELEKIAFKGADDAGVCDEMPYMQCDVTGLGDVRRKQNFVIDKLRSQLSSLYEATERESCEEDSDDSDDSDAGDDSDDGDDGDASLEEEDSDAEGSSGDPCDVMFTSEEMRSGSDQLRDLHVFGRHAEASERQGEAKLN